MTNDSLMPAHHQSRGLGSHLVDRFLADGAEMIGMDSFLTGRPENLAHLSGHPRFRFYRHDVTNFIFVEGPWTESSTSHRQRVPSTTWSCPSRRSRSARSARTRRSASPGKRRTSSLPSTSEIYGDPWVHPQPELYWGNLNLNPIGPRHPHRPDLQPLRTPHAPSPWAGGLELHRPGAPGTAPPSLWRREPDAIRHLVTTRSHP
jgi:hypothetical protein